MITELGRDSLTGLGARFRAAHLLEQASYTLELAAQDGRALDRLLPAGYVTEVKHVATTVLAAMRDPGLVAEEAREAAEANGHAVREARAWRKKVARRALRARAIGRQVPEVLVRVTEVDPPGTLMAQVTAMLAWMESDPEMLPGEDVRELVKEGHSIAQKLRNARAGEHAARLAALPDSGQRFCADKGILYVGLRVINDAAQELHAGDRAAAARYSLMILSRRTSSRRP